MSEPRKYSEIKAERAETDPKLRRHMLVLAEIDRLEAEAAAAIDPGASLMAQANTTADLAIARSLRMEAEEARMNANPDEGFRLQCEAEELRCGLFHLR